MSFQLKTPLALAGGLALAGMGTPNFKPAEVEALKLEASNGDANEELIAVAEMKETLEKILEDVETQEQFLASMSRDFHKRVTSQNTSYYEYNLRVADVLYRVLLGSDDPESRKLRKELEAEKIRNPNNYIPCELLKKMAVQALKFAQVQAGKAGGKIQKHKTGFLETKILSSNTN